MTGRFGRNVPVVVIALVAALLAVGIGLAYKARKNDPNANALSSVPQPVTALPPDAAKMIVPPHEYRGACFVCHPIAYNTLPHVQAAQPFDTWAVQPPAASGFSSPPNAVRQPFFGTTGEIAQAALAAPAIDAKGRSLLTPAEQNAADKVFVEGHWLGMELMDLTASLRRIYGLAPDAQGVIVDEITLESAESGILAGDVITSVGGRPTRDLTEFLRASEAVKDFKTVEVVVNRLGAEKRYSLVAKNTKVLGFAQVEGAQPIKPGALSPHRGRRRACTECHVMMATGGQLPVDEGDITPAPPPISPNATAPHQYRGPCNSCHLIQPNQ